MVIKSVFVTPVNTIHNFSKIKKFCNKPNSSPSFPGQDLRTCAFSVLVNQAVGIKASWNPKGEPKVQGQYKKSFCNKNNLFFSVQKRKKIQVTPMFFNFTFDKGRLKNLVSWTLQNYGKYKTLELLEQLKKTGFEYATKAGISLGIDDLKIPPKKKTLLLAAEKLTKSTVQQYERGEITAVERFQRLIDTWHRTSEQLKQEVIAHFEETDILNPVYMMAFSGARGNISQVRQLVGMRGLMSDPQGQIIDFPIRSNFREGLTLTEYIISSYGARKGIVDTALRTANAGYLTRRLVDVAQHVMISHYDCGTLRGIFLTDMKEGNKTLVSVQNRIVGRVLARDIFKPNTTIKIAKRNQEITTDLAFEIKKITNRVFVRSSLTCNTNKLLCQLCYGWSLAQGNLVSVGEAVGVIAAQSIGEPGTQLTMRTFHTGGVFSGDISDEIRAPYNGFIHYENQIPGILIRTIDGKIRFLTKADGILFFSLSSKSYVSTIQDLDVRKFKIPAYTILFMRNTEEVIKKQVVAQITSINTKLNIRDTAEFVIKAELEGVFYGKKLEISKKILGPKPKLFGEDKQKLNVDRTQLEYNGINPKAMEIIVKARGWNFAWVLSGKRYETPSLLKLFPIIGDYVNNQTIMARQNLQVPKNYSVSQLNNTSINQKLSSPRLKVTNKLIYSAFRVNLQGAPKGATRLFFALSDNLKSKPSYVWDQNKKKNNLGLNILAKKTKNNLTFRVNLQGFALKNKLDTRVLEPNSVLVRSNFSKIKKFLLFKVFSHPGLRKGRLSFLNKSVKTQPRSKFQSSTDVASLELLNGVTPKVKNKKNVLHNKLIRFPGLYQKKYVNTHIKLDSQFATLKSLITKKLFFVNPLSDGLYQDQKTKVNLSSSLQEISTFKRKQDSFGLQENLAMNKIFIKHDLLFLNTRKIKYYKIGYFHFLNNQQNLNNIPTLFFSKDKKGELNNYQANMLDTRQSQVILLSPSALKKDYILDREIKLKRIKSLSYLVESCCLPVLKIKDNLDFFNNKKILMKPNKFKENIKTSNLLVSKEKSPNNILNTLPKTKTIQSVCPILSNFKQIKNLNKSVIFPQTKCFTPNKKNKLASSTSLLQTKINFSKQLFVKILHNNTSLLGENLKYNRHLDKKINLLNKNKKKNAESLTSVRAFRVQGAPSKLDTSVLEQKNSMLFTIIKNSPDIVLIKRKIKKYKNMYKTNSLAIFNKTDKFTKNLNSLKNFRSHTEKKNNIFFIETQRAIPLPLVLQKTKTSLKTLLYKTYLKETFKRVWKPDKEFSSFSKVLKGQGLKYGLISLERKKEQPLITQDINIKDNTKFVPNKTSFIILSKDKKLLHLQNKNIFPTNYFLYKKSKLNKIRDNFTDKHLNNFISKKQNSSKEESLITNKVKTVFEYIVPSLKNNTRKLDRGIQMRGQYRHLGEDFTLVNKDNSHLGLKHKLFTPVLENTKKILKHFKKSKIKKVNFYTANKLNAIVLQKSNNLNSNLLGSPGRFQLLEQFVHSHKTLKENKKYIKSIISIRTSNQGCKTSYLGTRTKMTKKLLKYTISKLSNTDKIKTRLISFFKKACIQENLPFKIKNSFKKFIINKRKFLLTQKQIAYIFMYFQLKQKHVLSNTLVSSLPFSRKKLFFSLEYFKIFKNIYLSYKSIIENVKKSNSSKEKIKKVSVTKLRQTKSLKGWLKKTKLTSNYGYHKLLLTTKTKFPYANNFIESINSPNSIKFASISNKGVRFLQKNKLHMNINKNLQRFLKKLTGSFSHNQAKQKTKKARKNKNTQDRHFTHVDSDKYKQNKKHTKLIDRSRTLVRNQVTQRPKVKSKRENLVLATHPKIVKENIYEFVYIVLYNHKIAENKTKLSSKNTIPNWIYKTANTLSKKSFLSKQLSSSQENTIGNAKMLGNSQVLLKNKAIHSVFNRLTIYPGYSNVDTLLFNNIAIQSCFNIDKKQYFGAQRSNFVWKSLAHSRKLNTSVLEVKKNAVEKLNKSNNASPFGFTPKVKDVNFSILPDIFKENFVWVKNKNPRFLPKHLEQKTQSFKSVIKSPENYVRPDAAQLDRLEITFYDTFQSNIGQDYLEHGISLLEKDWQTVALIFKQFSSAFRVNLPGFALERKLDTGILEPNPNKFFLPFLGSPNKQITKYSLILCLNYLYKLNKINLVVEKIPNKKILISYLKNLKNALKEINDKKTSQYILFTKLPEINIMADAGLQKIKKKKTGLKLIKSIPRLEPWFLSSNYTRNQQQLWSSAFRVNLKGESKMQAQLHKGSKPKIKQIQTLQRNFYTYIFQDKRNTNYYSKQKKDLNLLKKNPSFAQSILSFQIHQKININRLKTNNFNTSSTWKSSNITKVREKKSLKNSIIRKVKSNTRLFSNSKNLNFFDKKQKNHKNIKLKQNLKSSNQSNSNYKKLISYTNVPFFSNLFKTSSYKFTYTAKNSKLLNLYNLHSKTKVSIIPNQPCLNFVFLFLKKTFLNIIKTKQTSLTKQWKSSKTSQTKIKESFFLNSLMLKNKSFNMQAFKSSNTIFLKKLEGVSNFLARTNFYSPFEGELLQIKPYKKYLELNPYKNVKTGLFSFNNKNTKDSQIRMAMFKYYLKNININKTIIKKGWSRFNLILTKNDLLALNYTKNTIKFKKGKLISLEQNLTVFSEIYAMSVNKRKVVSITPKITLAQDFLNYLVTNNLNNYFKIKTLSDFNKQNHFNNKSYSLLKNMWLKKILLITQKKEEVSKSSIKKIKYYKIKIYLPSSPREKRARGGSDNYLSKETASKEALVVCQSIGQLNSPGKLYYQQTISPVYLNNINKRKKAQEYFFSVYNSILNFNWLFCKQRHLLTKNKIGFFLLKGNRFINSSNKITNMLFNNFIFLNKNIYNLENMTILLQDSRCLDLMLSLELQKLHLNINCLYLKPLQDKSLFLKTIKMYSMFTKISSQKTKINNNKSWKNFNSFNLTLWEARVADLHISTRTALTLVLGCLNIATFVNNYKKQKFYLKTHNTINYSNNLAKSYKYLNYVKLLNLYSINYIQTQILISNLLSQFIENKHNKTLCVNFFTRNMLAYAWKINSLNILTNSSIAENVKHLVNNKKKQILLKNYKQKSKSKKSFLVIKKSGQILQMNKQKVTIRLGQPLVISPRSIIHGTHGDFITNKTAVITLTYLKLKTGDIVQGIPKIEQLFEARTTKRGRLFRDNVSNLLTGLFLKYFIQSTYILRTQTTIKTLEYSVDKEGLLDLEKNKIQTTKKINNKLYNQFLNNKHNEKLILALALQWSVKQSFYKIQQIIVDGILRVYRSQGVSIADKHVEIIVKQMTSKVRIINSSKFKLNEYKFSLKNITRNLNTEINKQDILSENIKTKKSNNKKNTDQNALLEQLLSNNFDGPTGLFPGEIVDIDFVENINNYLFKTSSLVKNNKFDFLFTAQNAQQSSNAFAVEPIKYEPIVLGITRASLEVESFLSAASFQQTTKVLSQAALYKKKDFLKGLKENIIIGNLIPAGTGYLSSINF
jgi:hypothetical protein